MEFFTIAIISSIIAISVMVFLLRDGVEIKPDEDYLNSKHIIIKKYSEDEIRLEAYLLAESDSFSKHPEFYWYEAQKKMMHDGRITQ
jgi:hypothetical protein